MSAQMQIADTPKRHAQLPVAVGVHILMMCTK
jgi:hypothetical protein